MLLQQRILPVNFTGLTLLIFHSYSLVTNFNRVLARLKIVSDALTLSSSYLVPRGSGYSRQMSGPSSGFEICLLLASGQCASVRDALAGLI